MSTQRAEPGELSDHSSTADASETGGRESVDSLLAEAARLVAKARSLCAHPQKPRAGGPEPSEASGDE